MKLNENEYTKYISTINERLDDIKNLFNFKNYFNNFKELALQQEKIDYRFNSSFYIKRFDDTFESLKATGSDVDRQLSKIKEILNQCRNVDVSTSFLTLLSSANKILSERDFTNLSADIKKQINAIEQNRIDSNFMWNTISILSSNLDGLINREKNALNPILVFNTIKEITSNIVLVGSNGSGKSRFSRSIAKSRSVDMPIVIIPAQHYLGFQEFNNMENIDYSEHIRANDQNTQLGIGNNDAYANDFGNLIRLLQTDFNHKSRTGKRNEILFDKVSELFSKLIKNRKLVFDTDIDKNIPVASTLNGKTYSINEMSDGEKTILYFIVHVLNAKQNSFVVIDEPENHLHYDSCISLWNELEKVRKDCTFLYLTHNIDFVLSRKNCAFVWNKRFEYPDNWETQILNDNEIPKKLYLDILGIVPPILYCEGGPDSIDKELYHAIYPDFIVKECGSCQIVRQYKIALSKLKLEKNKEIFAVVDRDFKTDDEIKKGYEQHGINVLTVLEAENLLFVPEIVNELFGASISDYFDDYFDLCNRELDFIVNRKLKTIIKDEINKIKSNSFYDSYLNNPNLRLTLKHVTKLRNDIVKAFRKIIKSRDYKISLQMFDLKDSLFAVANKFVPDYKEEVIKLLSTNNDIRKLVAEEYIGIPTK